MSKSFEKQLARVIGKMVKAGEVLAKKMKCGETMYAGAFPRVKAKPIASTKPAKTSPAQKAWETRRKNEKLKITRKIAGQKAAETKRKNKATKAKRTATALKAWGTRRSMMNNSLLRGKFSK